MIKPNYNRDTICKRASKNFGKFLCSNKHGQALEKIIWKQTGNKLSKKYGNKVREILFSLQNNKKIKTQVLKGELSLKRLTMLSTEEFASSELAKKRKRIQQEQLEQKIIKRKHFLGNRGDFSVLLTEQQDIIDQDISEHQRKVDILDISLVTISTLIKQQINIYALNPLLTSNKLIQMKNLKKNYKKYNYLKTNFNKITTINSKSLMFFSKMKQISKKSDFSSSKIKSIQLSIKKKKDVLSPKDSFINQKNLEWKGIIKDAFSKKTFKASIKYMAGKKINLNNLFPKIMSSNGRIRYSNIRQVMPMLKNVGPYKSHMLCKLDCYDRSQKKDYDDIFESYEKSQRGIVIDLKKNSSFKLYIFPPYYDAKKKHHPIPSQMIRNIWGVDPPKDKPWGYIIYYHQK